MKRILSVLLAVILLLTVRSSAEIDLSGMTDEELTSLLNAAELPLALREEIMVQGAIEVLKDFWINEYQNDFYENSTGYLEIIHTRIVYLRNPEIAYGLNAGKLKEFSPAIHAIVEFIFLTDYFCSAPYYYESGMLSRGNNVLVYADGTMQITGNFLNMLRSRTYESDFSGIIESISDLGSSHNGVYHLKEH